MCCYGTYTGNQALDFSALLFTCRACSLIHTWPLTGPPPVPATAPTVLQQIGAQLLLISPFFFWGTSMVAMKARISCSAPQLGGWPHA